MTQIISPNSCRTCKHVFEEGKAMHCRRYPPTVHLIPTAQGVASHSSFPTVNTSMLCGEYERSIIKV